MSTPANPAQGLLDRYNQAKSGLARLLGYPAPTPAPVVPLPPPVPVNWGAFQAADARNRQQQAPPAPVVTPSPVRAQVRKKYPGMMSDGQ